MELGSYKGVVALGEAFSGKSGDEAVLGSIAGLGGVVTPVPGTRVEALEPGTDQTNTLAGLAQMQCSSGTGPAVIKDINIDIDVVGSR